MSTDLETNIVSVERIHEYSKTPSEVSSTYNVVDLGPVAPISVNFNHQLAYFADQSDTTHVLHQPTAVA